MRIVYCIPSYYKMAGMERVLTQKVNYLTTHTDCEILIITTDQDGNDVLKGINSKVAFQHFDLNFSTNYTDIFIKKYIEYKVKLKKYKKELQNLLLSYKADICISMGGKEISFLPLLKDKSTKICELHFSKDVYRHFYRSRNNTLFNKIHAEIMTKRLEILCKNFDKLVVLTQRDEIEWRKVLNNVEQIYNPFPITHFYEPNYASKNVIAVGRLDEQKGFMYLIDVWVKVNKLYPDWKLNIWGEGPLHSTLKNKILKMGLQDNIYLCGSTDKIYEEYTKNSIFVMTSQFEGFPMVLLEASIAGLPLVSFDCSTGPSEIIKNNKNGFLVPLNDVQEMSKSIINLINDDDLRTRFGQNAQEAVSEFELSFIMTKWLKLFSSYLKN